MNNIEKMAIEHGIEPAGFGDRVGTAGKYVCTLEQLEAFAQALQSSEPVGKVMPICNLWVNPKTLDYEVDRCTHPLNELIPVYTLPPSTVTLEEHNKRIAELEAAFKALFVDREKVIKSYTLQVETLKATNKTLSVHCKSDYEYLAGLDIGHIVGLKEWLNSRIKALNATDLIVDTEYKNMGGSDIKADYPPTLITEPSGEAIKSLQATNKTLLDALDIAKDVLEAHTLMHVYEKLIADAEGVDG